jgi:hypothetical protein
MTQQYAEAELQAARLEAMKTLGEVGLKAMDRVVANFQSLIIKAITT